MKKDINKRIILIVALACICLIVIVATLVSVRNRAGSNDEEKIIDSNYEANESAVSDIGDYDNEDASELEINDNFNSDMSNFGENEVVKCQRQILTDPQTGVAVMSLMVDDVGISVVGTGEMEEPDTTNDVIDIEGNATTEPNTTPSMEPDESGNGTTENPDSMSSQEFINAWENDSYLSIFEVPKFGESITIYKYDGYSSAFFYGWTTDEASTFGYDTVSAAGFTNNVQTQIDADNFYYVGSNDQGYGVMVVKEQGGYVMVSVGDYGIMMGSSSTTVDDKVDSKLGNFQKDAFEKIGALE